MGGAVRAIAIAAALTLAACGRGLPPPRILGITPAEIVQGSVPEVRIDLDAIFPFDVRYGPPELTVNTDVRAEIGGVPVRRIMVGADGALAAFAPFALPVGTHDVWVELSDGRAATLPDAFTVLPGAFPDSFAVGGASPDVPIANATQSQPFTIAIEALGGRAAEFNGAVRISVSHGTIEPDLSGPFVAGRRDEIVSIPALGTGVTITVEDALGHQGTSNPFDVLN